MRSLTTSPRATTTGAPPGRKRRSAYNTNVSGKYRSVVDYEEDELRLAMVTAQGGGNGDGLLLSDEMNEMILAIQDGQPVQKVAKTAEDQKGLHEQLEWVLPYYDPVTTRQESLTDEICRLQNVKSYLLLDNERDAAFDRITDLATRIFDVPMSVISLIDLGRQWLVSYRGIDAQELHRKDAVCAQTIMTNANFLIIPDLSKDPRTRDVITVSGPPHLRFYAAASLTSPEGYRLGTFCIIDPRPRPQGLTADETRTLIDLADIAVKVMVDRRFQLEKERSEDPGQVIAYTAHDILAPLNGMQLSLSMLKEDEAVQSLSERQTDLLNKAASSTDTVSRIWQDTLHEMEARTNGTKSSPLIQSGPWSPDGNVQYSKQSPPTTRLDELVRNLRVTIDLLGRNVPPTVDLEQSSTVSATEIVADELKLFRCAINLLTCAMNRAAEEPVTLTIRPIGSILIFECEDRAEDIPVEQYEHLYRTSHPEAANRVGMLSVAALVKSMDGEYGFRPRGIDIDGSVVKDASQDRRAGSIFWFSIPLVPAPSGLREQHLVDVLPLELVQSVESLPNLLLDPTSQTSILPTTQGIEFVSLLEADQLGFESDHAYATARTCSDAIANFAATTMVSTVLSEHFLPEEDDKLTAILKRLDGHGSLPTEGSGDGFPSLRRSSHRRILMIDDSMVVRRNLAQVLNGLGYDAIHAANGAQGLLEMQKSLFDVVFCDFVMPVMDGLSCVATFRQWEEANRPWDRQLIVGISENANSNDNGKGHQAGMDMFCPKPITTKTVSDVIASEEFVTRMEKLDEWEPSGSASDANDELSPQEERQNSSTRFDVQSSGISPESAPPVCLIAARERASSQPDPISQMLESKGWRVVAIDQGPDCLRLLQLRTWDAALIDDDLPQLAGTACITAFRQWELLNRVNVQTNLFLVCSGFVPSPSDTNSVVQLPNGCNGVLARPVPLDDFEYLFQNRQR